MPRCHRLLVSADASRHPGHHRRRPPAWRAWRDRPRADPGRRAAGRAMSAAASRGGCGRCWCRAISSRPIIARAPRSSLPHLSVELVHSRAFLLSEPLAAAAIEWATALTAAALPEGQPYPALFEGLDGLLDRDRGGAERARLGAGAGPLRAAAARRARLRPRRGGDGGDPAARSAPPCASPATGSPATADRPAGRRCSPRASGWSSA